ncbi:MAG: sigma 54-interacting transcriptional regulator [Nitrospirales bacterium]|nr:sigma 54-interacting transcriptional regulator [Nitrospirales bacterium]
MVKKNIFFREVTVRICSSLQIESALKNVAEYLKDHFPLDILSLAILDSSLSAIRHVARSETGEGEPEEAIFPLPEGLWEQVMAKVKDFREPRITTDATDSDDLLRAIAQILGMEGKSQLLTPLWIAEDLIGFLCLQAAGEGRYTTAHAGLIATVAEPFAIALSNTLAHEKVLRYRDTLIDDNRFLTKELFAQGESIIGADSGLKDVMEMVRQVAPLNNTVLLLGETGTGKEVIANAIHSASARKDGPFIKVNCGAIPEGLIDSELFGHEKGAFTGAVSQKRGRFERAHGGTIFLDEIGELPHQAQVRLLRVLQSKEIERVGGSRQIPVDIRIIAATHRNLESMVSENRFREDLWFRLNVFPIVMPPLRYRQEDIPALIRHFVREKSQEFGMPLPPDIHPTAMARLMNYPWPGNVRELQNLVERELIRNRNSLLIFGSLLSPEKEVEESVSEKETEAPLPETSGGCHPPLKLDEAIALHISRVLDMTKGKIHGSGGAAELLDMNPSTLRWRIEKLGICSGRKRKGTKKLAISPCMS